MKSDILKLIITPFYFENKENIQHIQNNALIFLEIILPSLPFSPFCFFVLFLRPNLLTKFSLFLQNPIFGQTALLATWYIFFPPQLCFYYSLLLSYLLLPGLPTIACN